MHKQDTHRGSSASSINQSVRPGSRVKWALDLSTVGIVLEDTTQIDGIVDVEFSGRHTVVPACELVVA